MATAPSALGVVFLGSLFSTALERRGKGLDADIISLQDAAAPIPLVIRQNGRAHDARGMVMCILQVGDGGAAKNIPRRNVSRPEPSYRTMIYLPSSRVLSVPDSEGPIVYVVDQRFDLFLPERNKLLSDPRVKGSSCVRCATRPDQQISLTDPDAR